MTGDVNYGPVGATRPGDQVRTDQPSGYRCWARTVHIGAGQAYWDTVASDVLDWAVKTRSGFAVRAARRAVAGEDHLLTARIGPFPNPSGSWWWSMSWTAAGSRTATRSPAKKPSSCIALPTGGVADAVHHASRWGSWRLAFPAIVVAQRWYRWRYRRALT